MGSIPIVSTQNSQVSDGTCGGNSCERNGRAHHVPKGGSKRRLPAGRNAPGVDRSAHVRARSAGVSPIARYSAPSKAEFLDGDEVFNELLNRFDH